ncbi:hypothetical protein GS429_16555 [Natronorubrum sp. JWXQ-INN-674]|uniref:Uncharacterized protein n=1 Tax=Natronorubrum halalkaliphilum TaxID=2691917 RepID=A0A6B0VPT0_9EURY|nr:hypothetical protein [Natronorubrum halalkaliphilum]MXV63640.1 hypothetical protein [Natronorubrum halalkaliphilum]
MVLSDSTRPLDGRTLGRREYLGPPERGPKFDESLDADGEDVLETFLER